MDSQTSKKILIVEDDEGFAYILQKSLENAGFSTVTAKDGEQGLEALKQERPDLILLDISMPRLDGIEMTKRMKEAGVNIAIIYLSNLKDTENISRAMAASGGSADYIVKTDVKVEDIIERIKKRLSLS
jgi:two-component system alkaline phosphatase synthesis response regulator PhoP